MSVTESPSDAPYGIVRRHLNVGRFARFRTVLAAAIFVVSLGSAMMGWLGGGAPVVKAYASPAARVTLEYEPILRSGNWFETVLTITPTLNVDDLVVSVDQPLWQGMSIDTLAPDAESATSTDGRYSYHFGKVSANQPMRVKFDGQIQPRAFRRLTGNITLLDGERQMMTLPMSITILP